MERRVTSATVAVGKQSTSTMSSSAKLTSYVISDMQRCQPQTTIQFLLVYRLQMERLQISAAVSCIWFSESVEKYHLSTVYTAVFSHLLRTRGEGMINTSVFETCIIYPMLLPTRNEWRKRFEYFGEKSWILWHLLRCFEHMGRVRTHFRCTESPWRTVAKTHYRPLLVSFMFLLKSVSNSVLVFSACSVWLEEWCYLGMSSLSSSLSSWFLWSSFCDWVLSCQDSARLSPSWSLH